MKTSLAVIIGVGIIGASLAHRLAKSGARVTVLDAGLPASGASGASFGWLNASYFATPAHHHLRVAALQAHRALDLELATGTNWQGSLWWEDSGPALDAFAASLGELGYPVHPLSRRAFQALEPTVANPPERALYLPGEGAVDAAGLTHTLLATAASHGAQVWLSCPATGFCQRAGRVTGVSTAQGPLAADHVIIAAGVATPALLAPLGFALPRLPRPGLMLQTRPIAPLIGHMLVAPGQEVRQTRRGHLIAPAAASHQADTAEAINSLPGDLAQSTLNRLRALLPGADLELERVACAWRPVPADGLPVVGAVGAGGLFVAMMHSGVTLAPLIADLLTAEVLTAEVLTGQPALVLAPFRPSRFLSAA